MRRRLQRLLSRCAVAIKAVVHVGAALAGEGARLLAANVGGAAARRTAARTGAVMRAPAELLSKPDDVLAPCAQGEELDASAVRLLRAAMVYWAANNQLVTAGNGDRLAERDVLFVPDCVTNSGGIVNVAASYLRWTPAEEARVGMAHTLLQRIIAAEPAELLAA